MMQNLTLPSSQTLALGATLSSRDAKKNSASADKPSPAEPNTSFEMLLNRQVKAHKDAIQQKPVQQNSTQKKTTDQKQVQHKADQGKQSNGELVQSNQNSDDSLDANISMAQMVGDAKAMFAKNDEENSPVALQTDKQTEEVANDRSLINSANPTFSSEVLKLSSAAILGPVRNNASADNNKENKLLNIDVSAALNSPIATQNNVGINQQNLDVGDTDSQQDRVLWASVSATKLNQTALNQNNELADGNALLNASKEGTAKTTDGAKFADVVSGLAINANQQSLAPQSTSILSAHQLGNSNQINAYPGKAGWDHAISQKVVWMVGAAEQTATLTLNPPDLGPLQVVINVRNDMADTTFISDNAEVRQALQDGMANLREKMAESGIQLGQANVNSGERPKQEFQQAILNQQSSKFSGANSILPIEETTQKVSVSRINNGLVDTFV